MLNKLARSGSETPLCVTNQQSRYKQKREGEQHFASWSCICTNRTNSDRFVERNGVERGWGTKEGLKWNHVNYVSFDCPSLRTQC